MAHRVRRLGELKFLIAESATQYRPDENPRPQGTLGPLYLLAALGDAGYPADYLDMTVGSDEDSLEATFKPTLQPNGLVRFGMSPEQLMEKIQKGRYDVFAISSILTNQTRMVFEAIRAAKMADPDILVLTGGVNARSLLERFFNAGADAICLTEGERVIVAIAHALSRGEDYRNVSGIAYREDGVIHRNPVTEIIMDLDELPIAAWDRLPLEKYWTINTPHAGDFSDGEQVRYASMTTSRGCPYSCQYCHIAGEKNSREMGGDIGRYRLKSIERVMHEADILKGLGVQWVFFEDDSLLAKRARVMEIFRRLIGKDLLLADVNGVNLAHLFTPGRSGTLVPNRELLELMVEAGFRQITLPFESGDQQMIDRWATGKWRVDTHDVVALVRTCVDVGLKVPGGFIVGYPNETRETLQRTFDLARRLVQNGLTYATFFNLIPAPGSPVFDYCLQHGHLDPNFDTDDFNWRKYMLKNTVIPAAELERLNYEAWREINRPDYIGYRVGKNVANRWMRGDAAVVMSKV